MYCAITLRSERVMVKWSRLSFYFYTCTDKQKREREKNKYNFKSIHPPEGMRNAEIHLEHVKT